jgi:hypothetical protein
MATLLDVSSVQHTFKFSIIFHLVQLKQGWGQVDDFLWEDFMILLRFSLMKLIKVKHTHTHTHTHTPSS